MPFEFPQVPKAEKDYLSCYEECMKGENATPHMCQTLCNDVPD